MNVLRWTVNGLVAFGVGLVLMYFIALLEGDREALLMMIRRSEALERALVNCQEKSP